MDSKLNYKIIIEIEPDFDFSFVENKKGFIYSKRLLVGKTLNLMKEKKETLKSIFISDTISFLKNFSGLDIRNLNSFQQMYPEKLEDTLLKFADSCGDEEVRQFLYDLFAPYPLIDKEREKYQALFDERLLRKKVTISLIEDGNEQQP